MYKKGGICKEHGPGATLKMKPVWTTVVGDDGVGVKKLTKKGFYVCDLDIDDRKLSQTKLSFVKTTPGRKLDTIQKEGGLFNTSMLTAGPGVDSERGV